MNKEYATLKDVAQLAGTSAATVSYVLNDSKGRYISEDMRTRVLNAAKELNYVKSSLASSLKGKKRKIIAVLVPQFFNQYFTRVVVAIEHIADKYDYILAICNTFDNPKREKEIISRLAEHRVDGYIIAPTNQGFENTNFIRNLKIPMVIIDRTLSNIKDYNFVSSSQYECGYVGGDYLTKNGHENIAFVYWDPLDENLMSRNQGFLDAVIKNGVNQNKVKFFDGEFSDMAGYLITKKILKNHPEITAIFYSYNVQAKGGVQLLSEESKEVGKDISVMLIGSPEWAVAGKNNFTHIDQKEHIVGEKAAETLFELIINNEKENYVNFIQPCTLCEGNSVIKLN